MNGIQTSDTLFETAGLSKVYKGYAAVNNVQMTVKRGDIYGFIGANGAGKTTLIRMLCGIIFPTSGSMRLFGAESEPQLVKARQKIGFIVESPALMRGYTGYDALAWHKQLTGAKTADINSLLSLVGLEGTGGKKVKDFSLGMRQRLAIAQALLNNPEFLVLDEPANGMDPQGMVEMRELLKRLNHAHGITILISSHILSELEQVATKVGIIHKGALLDERQMSDLTSALGAAVIVEVDKPEDARAVISGGGINVSVTGNKLALKDFEGDIIKVLARLQKNGVDVKGFWKQEDTLESYFFKTTEGHANA
ncbi:MAG: ABC transporter ATP-binding protein [Clostridiales bacterium]|jgi:ABC-2 type transport system ATP-binding protein|nr:ABC transporter ATP-binding protein [Clostridiales bacterium]